MKKINILLLGLVVSFASCGDLDQAPENIASANSLTDFTGVLNAAYNYQTGSATPLAVMGDYRADNIIFDESPHNSFQAFDGTVRLMEGDFFSPIWESLYKSILSANNVIENSDNATQVAEAKFLRGLSYFKLVKVFGDVPVNLSATPDVASSDWLTRQSASSVYTSVIVKDLTEAIAELDNSGLSTSRATKLAAQGILGKAYLQMGDAAKAAVVLGSAVSGATGAGVELEAVFANVFASDLSNEVIYATQISSSIAISDYSGTAFPGWYSGTDSKGDEFPVTPSLVNAFDASGADDVRRAVTLDETTANVTGIKYNGHDIGDQDVDFIELRLADVILAYAEALNESNGSGAADQLNKIRNRAGLANTTASTQSELREAIANERRLELAFEGQRWFDLVRAGQTGQDAGYNVFPIPSGEIFASGGVITQNGNY